MTGDPQRVLPRQPRPGSSERWFVRGRAAAVEFRGARSASQVPLTLIGDRRWAGVAVGSRVVATGRLGLDDPAARSVALLQTHGAPRPDARPGLAWRVAESLRAGLRRACVGLPSDTGGLLPALVVGDTSGLDEQVRADLRTAGLSHLTAVSGTNVTITAAAAVLALAAVGAGRRARFVGGVLAVAGFVVLARPEPSVLRAAVMGALTLAGVLLGRRGIGVPVLAGAVLGLLLTDPWLARSFGFALSVSATAALIVLAPAWLRRRDARLARRLEAGGRPEPGWRAPLAATFAVPLAAQLVTAPVTVLLNPGVSLVGVPANVLAAPAVAPATVLGVLSAAVSPVSPTLAHLLAVLGGQATRWIVLVARTAAGLPWATLPWPQGPAGALALLLVTSVGLVLTMRAGGGLPVAVGYVAVVLVVCLVVTGGGLRVLPGGGVPRDWVVLQCAVGQGSATALRSGPDRAVLVDTGPEPEAVDRCLRRAGVRVLDLVLLTHFHADHVDGLPGALAGRGAPPMLVSPYPQPADRWRAVTAEAARGGDPVLPVTGPLSGTAGTGDRALRWLALPPRPPPTPSGRSDDDPDGSQVNDASAVLLVELAGLRVLALGDLEPQGQAGLLRSLATTAPDVLERPLDVVVVAHHGSARQSPQLYQRLRPRVALIGVGTNDYGHPAPSALTMLGRLGAVVGRTDTQGTVAVVVRDGRLHLVTGA